ncbi:hypothetical protein EV363DRAFT_1585270 [Boletus edulis]|nr:hypothetical protein EV363DRAFT_1586896 [Boletus edulis]KAF8128002.1 hypothetical protein EV363DRAFT_1585270 [Boletus edulis]
MVQAAHAVTTILHETPTRTVSHRALKIFLHLALSCWSATQYSRFSKSSQRLKDVYAIRYSLIINDTHGGRPGTFASALPRFIANLPLLSMSRTLCTTVAVVAVLTTLEILEYRWGECGVYAVHTYYVTHRYTPHSPPTPQNSPTSSATPSPTSSAYGNAAPWLLCKIWAVFLMLGTSHPFPLSASILASSIQAVMQGFATITSVMESSVSPAD